MSKKVIDTVVKIGAKIDAPEYVKANGYPEVGAFEDKKALQKFYKKLTTEQLIDWCDIEGLTYKVDETSEPITRMRICMAILYKHYPRVSAPKKESPYKKYSLNELVELAVSNDVGIEETTDERILRMRLVMALRVAKVI